MTYPKIALRYPCFFPLFIHIQNPLNTMAQTTIETKHGASYAQLLAMLTQVAGNIAFEKANVTNAYKALIGELGKTAGENPVDHTVVSYIAAKIAEVNGAAEALEGRVADNEAAIALLNNNSETVGSVDYKINQAFNDFVAKVSDDKVVNTFKEMIDYVAAHQTEYANLGALVGTIPSGATSTTVVGYAKEVADAAQKEADDRLDIIEGEGEGSIKKAVKDLADGAVAANATAIATEQERAEAAEGAIIEAINSFSYLTEEEVDTIKALFPIA